jgi:hypothetical protein
MPTTPGRLRRCRDLAATPFLSSLRFNVRTCSNTVRADAQIVGPSGYPGSQGPAAIRRPLAGGVSWHATAFVCVFRPADRRSVNQEPTLPDDFDGYARIREEGGLAIAQASASAVLLDDADATAASALEQAR